MVPRENFLLPREGFRFARDEKNPGHKPAQRVPKTYLKNGSNKNDEIHRADVDYSQEDCVKISETSDVGIKSYDVVKW